MTTQEFLIAFQDILQSDENFNVDTPLAQLEEWDSLAFMALIAFFDKNFKIQLTFENITACTTVSDIIALAKGAIA